MPTYIVLRLTPPTAIDAATFTTYLNNLNINVYDISYTDPSVGKFIGSAKFVGPVYPPPGGPPPGGTRIVQHVDPIFLIPDERIRRI